MARFGDNYKRLFIDAYTSNAIMELEVDVHTDTVVSVCVEHIRKGKFNASPYESLKGKKVIWVERPDHLHRPYMNFGIGYIPDPRGVVNVGSNPRAKVPLDYVPPRVEAYMAGQKGFNHPDA